MARILTSLFAILFVFNTTGEAKETSKFQSGAWFGSAYISDKTGRFSNCTASATYKSGIVLYVTVFRDYSWDVMLQAKDWHMKKGQKIPVRFRIGNSGWRKANAEAFNQTTVIIPIPQKGHMVTKFRRGNLMEVWDGKTTYSFSLKGTSRLMASLAKCVGNQLAREESSTGFGSASAAKSNSVEEAEKALREEKYKQESTRVLFSFLLATHIADAKLIASEDAPENMEWYDAVAIAPRQIAAVHLLAGQKASGQKKLIRKLIAGTAKSCDGQFASQASTTDVDGVRMNNGFVACKSDKLVLHGHYVLTPRKSGGSYFIVLISWADIANGTTQPASADDYNMDIETFSRAALTSSQ